MTYERTPAHATNRTLIIVVAILAGVIFLGVGGCVGLGLLSYLWARQTVEQASAQAELASAEAEERNQAVQQAATEAERRQAELQKGLPSAELHDEAQLGVNQFVEHLGAGRADEAYRMTSAAFQRRYDRAGFGKFLEENPQLSKRLRYFGGIQPEASDQKVLRFRFVGPMQARERVEVKLTLVREDERWRIDEIDVRADMVPQP